MSAEYEWDAAIFNINFLGNETLYDCWCRLVNRGRMKGEDNRLNTLKFIKVLTEGNLEVS